MKRKLLALGVVVAAAAALSTVALAQRAATTKLVGTVGPGYTISLTVGGKKVARLKAGTYTLTINDKASIHAWSLDGPNGFARDFTKVPFVGTKTFTVKLKAGKYKYYCPPHESMMFGHFTVL
jgi:plastocyanin